MTITLPQYQCHKKVWALKIGDLVITNAGGTHIEPADTRFAPFATKPGWAERFDIKSGKAGDLGYYVLYEDGYESWSPSEVFEAGYTRIESAAG